jgi:hypothetical protein
MGGARDWEMLTTLIKERAARPPTNLSPSDTYKHFTTHKIIHKYTTPGAPCSYSVLLSPKTTSSGA